MRSNSRYTKGVQKGVREAEQRAKFQAQVDEQKLTRICTVHYCVRGRKREKYLREGEKSEKQSIFELLFLPYSLTLFFICMMILFVCNVGFYFLVSCRLGQNRCEALQGPSARWAFQSGVQSARPAVSPGAERGHPALRPVAQPVFTEGSPRGWGRRTEPGSSCRTR